MRTYTAPLRRPEGTADRQGGDLRHVPRHEDVLDLGTCVNRYGPPPAVGSALRSIAPRALRPHPYEACDDFASAFAAHMGVRSGDLLVGRGITEFLTVLSRLFPQRESVVITPDYTDTIRLFLNHSGPADGVRDSAAARAERVEKAMRTHRYVVLSNPNNPLGVSVPRQELVRICAANPRSVLVVDEAYADFAAESSSMTTCDLDNVVVLQSPNKPFGIAGVRAGGLWTRDRDLHERVRAALPNWPISYLDAVAATAALSEREWARSTRARLLESGRRLQDVLTGCFGDGVETGAAAHYRFVHLDDPFPVYERLLEEGVVVRVFSGTDPGRVSGLRVVAPTEDEMGRVEQAFSRLRA